MIEFEYPKDDGYGAIICRIDHALDNGPFTFICTNDISGEIVWRTDGMEVGWYSVYNSPCNCSAVLLDSSERVRDSWRWSASSHGDLVHRIFEDWCDRNPGAKGIAVGTHDGTTGEWVSPVRNGKLHAFLVEASERQYMDLFRNYRDFSNSVPLQFVVTPQGGYVDFFESDFSYTNSVSKEHALSFSSDVTSVRKCSVSLNDLIELCGLGSNLRWLHLDVEGIDDELLMSLDSTRFSMPEVIVFETFKMEPGRKGVVYDWLKDLGYVCSESGYNSIAMLDTKL